MSSEYEEPPVKTVIVTLESVYEQLETLKSDLTDTRFEQAIDRQRIAVLEKYIEVKETMRRDYDWEATKLMNELINRKGGMDYRDIKNFSHVKSNSEALRLMDRVLKVFSKDIRELKVGKRGKRVLIKRRKY